MICHISLSILDQHEQRSKPWLVALYRGCTSYYKLYQDYFVSHEIRLVVRTSQDFMVHVTDWLNVSTAHMLCMYHYVLNTSSIGCLGWWFEFLGSPYERDRYLEVPLQSQTTNPNQQITTYYLIESPLHIVGHVRCELDRYVVKLYEVFQTGECVHLVHGQVC